MFGLFFCLGTSSGPSNVPKSLLGIKPADAISYSSNCIPFSIRRGFPSDESFSEGARFGIKRDCVMGKPKKEPPILVPQVFRHAPHDYFEGIE